MRLLDAWCCLAAFPILTIYNAANITAYRGHLNESNYRLSISDGEGVFLNDHERLSE